MLTKKAFLSKTGKQIWYWLYLPKDFDSNKVYPFVLFLHGAGERGNPDGSEMNLVSRMGFLKNVKKGKEYPFIIVAPQCHKEEFWGGYIESLNGLLDFIEEEYKIDPSKRYLTGLSMGGFGSYLLAMDRENYFAALNLACPSSICWYAEKLINTPIMVYHGKNDKTISVKESMAMVKAINKRGGQATLNILENVGHEAWLYTFNDDTVKWLLSNSLKESSK